MLMRQLIHIVIVISALIMILATGCSHDSKILESEPFPTNAEVFRDEFGSTVTYQAFAGSKLDALDLDQINTYSGSQALQVTVPDVGDASGSFAGGAFTCDIARDLTGYNALTFYAKASRNATLDVAGIGNDNTGTSIYTAEATGLALTTSWQKYTIPIPLSAKLTAEKGLFYFAEGPEDGSGCQIWFDEIIFEDLGTISNPQPVIPTVTLQVEETDTITVSGATVTFDVDGSSETVSAMPAYFTFISSDEAVVHVAGNGVITAVGEGISELTATLGATPASGAVTVEVAGASAVPTTPAPTPTVPEADVISVYSDAYTDVPVDFWMNLDWEYLDADTSTFTIGDNDVKKLEIRTYTGIQFANPTIDASGMTHFHMDIWTPNSTESPAQFTIKLVDYGADGVYGGGNDVEDELAFRADTSPGLATGTWVSLDVPLTAFDELLTKSHLSQIIISGDLSIVYVDNVYFYNGGELTAPTVPAPTPSEDAGSVVSVFSDVYSDISVNSWLGSGSSANVEDYAIGSDNTKKYTNLVLAIIDFRSSTIDATAMTHFHMNVWTPDATSSPSVFKIKLIDFGENGVYNYGGVDDVESEITLGESTMNTGIWVDIDVPLDLFDELITRGHIGMMVISGTPNTVFVDNIYFYNSGVPLSPPEPAPTPTETEADVISVFSDAYTSIDFDTWSSEWDDADVLDFVVASDNLKKYYNLVFSIAEYTTSGTLDLTTMTHFHMDVWTPVETNSSSEFKIKLVDYGANGVWDGGGDDVEHELTFDETTMSTGSWVSLDIPLDDFAGMTTRMHFAQMILSGTYETAFIDNVYFYK